MSDRALHFPTYSSLSLGLPPGRAVSGVRLDGGLAGSPQTKPSHGSFSSLHAPWLLFSSGPTQLVSTELCAPEWGGL